ncbi:DNA/RNA non-specific endonuclease [Chitinophaga silvatica]|uniref:DNA/RNA non-specific endonuclease n=1 Tax=Chitinophaga silvatica TaxID=2282649 RepID=A0A3E1YGM9_9BACT|nr:DNA/RNA non-specific endonuclease [Chitinophaga silvatica]RFS26526.1 DNA/RNA non-specific endonuclease [Chitinophaga silvatica]
MPKKKTQEKGFNSLAVLLILAVATFVVTTCNRKLTADKGKPPAGQSNSDKPKAEKKANKSTRLTLLKEDFESGSKSNYNSEEVELSSGSWTFKNAVLGNGAEDKKVGKQSLRLRDNGSASMNFDITHNGTATVTVKYALYGNDNGGEWELWTSINRGQRFVKVGEAVKVSSGNWNTATFVVAANGNIRFQIRKTDKENSRINFDSFVVVAGGKLDAEKPTEKTTPGDNDNMLLGNPSGATRAIVMANNFLMDKGFYKISYNRDNATPNWVSWHVDRRDIGKMARANNFRADFDLPGDWYQANENSYKGSGFDRGHNCPSGDRTSSRAGNEATFLMTNMIPQAPNHNQHLWKNLEDYTRELVMNGNEVYIIMGSYGTGGKGSNGNSKKIDRNRINVPSNIWKVIVVLSDGGNDLQRINKNTRVIAVNTPNNNDVNSRWSAYLTSIESIEKATGYKLLDKVPETVRQELIKKIDNEQ